jgi:hypothetical protein
VGILGAEDAHISYHSLAYFGMIHSTESLPYLRGALYPYLVCMPTLNIGAYKRTTEIGAHQQTIEKELCTGTDYRESALEEILETFRTTASLEREYQSNARLEGPMPETSHKNKLDVTGNNGRGLEGPMPETSRNNGRGLEKPIQKTSHKKKLDVIGNNGRGLEKVIQKTSHKKKLGVPISNGNDSLHLHHFSLEAVAVLMGYYEQCQWPDTVTKICIAKVMHMTYQQICSWFCSQRKRAGIKRVKGTR